MHVLMDVMLIFALTVSLLSIFYGMPGNFFMVISSLFYGIGTGFESYSLTFIIILLGIVVALEAVEFILISFTAKKYGSSKWGIFGAVVGGIVGAISGAFVTPVVGAIVGSVVGVFLGAFLMEFMIHKDVKGGIVSGFGAFLGKIGGMSIKVIGAVTMASMILYKVI
ncbi:MAG TPA: DUF456 domain-containing protein [Calditrichaeota bacterium]|nr:DUF456 domain-containing protein [Calditrichota bacterium]